MLSATTYLTAAIDTRATATNGRARVRRGVVHDARCQGAARGGARRECAASFCRQVNSPVRRYTLL